MKSWCFKGMVELAIKKFETACITQPSETLVCWNHYRIIEDSGDRKLFHQERDPPIKAGEEWDCKVRIRYEHSLKVISKYSVQSEISFCDLKGTFLYNWKYLCQYLICGRGEEVVPTFEWRHVNSHYGGKSCGALLLSPWILLPY